MKKYRLKEEVKKYLEFPQSNPMNLKYWEQCGFKREALEEVEERIELECVDIASKGKVFKWSDGLGISAADVELFNKAKNGELLDIDSLDDADFGHWYYNNELVDVDVFDYTAKHRGIKAVLKQYLNDR